MSFSSDPVDIHAFVAQHNPSKSRVFALVSDPEHPNGSVNLEAVATISEPSRADELCAALNQYLYDRDEAQGVKARLRALLAGEPDSVTAAVQGIITPAPLFRRPYKDPVLTGISPYGPFPLSNCPPDGCPACGECVNWCMDCEVCDEFDEGCECDVLMPPRTAALVHAVAEIYCDTIHDLANEIPSAVPLRPHDDLWPVPAVAHQQNREFYQRFARVFEDIARDIEGGEPPQPHSMAEEIALQLTLERAEEMVKEEDEEYELFSGGLPRSRFDFDFNLLQSALFQDKDYEFAYLLNSTIAKPGELEEWFEYFNFPESRDPNRGFHR